jgi:hypothetical protein
VSERSGCLLALLGGAAPKRIGSGLPRLEASQVHPADRAALAKAQAAAEAANAAFSGPGVADIAVADLANQLGSILGVVHRLATELKDARQYLSANDPDKIARERADLEMRRLDASASEILALRTATAALTKRATLADEVRTQIATLEARLIAAGHELEAFRGKVTARSADRDLAGELAGYLRSAEQVLEAHERTRREMSSVR